MKKIIEGMLGKNWKAWMYMHRAERKNLRKYKKNRKRYRRRMNKWPTHKDMHYEEAINIPKDKDVFKARW